MTFARKIVHQLVVGLCFVSIVTAQWDTEAQDEDVCETPTGEQGVCITIRSCQSIIDMLSNAPKPLPPATIQFLQSYGCGFEGTAPKVCCPPAETTPPIDTEAPPDVSNHKNLGLINNRKCGPIFIDKIYGGNKTSPYEYPWMALIAYKTKTGLGFRCGGTLINDRYILTAAHCITELQSYTLAGVRLGEHDIRTAVDCDSLEVDDCAPPVQDRSIEEVIPHPLYNPTKLENDIGLLRLSAPADLSVETVKPICLPVGALASETLVGKNAIVAGWGATESGIISEPKGPFMIGVFHSTTRPRYSSAQLLKVALPVIPNEDCQARYNATRTQIKIGIKQLCAGGVNGKDSCSGDSGGPLKYMGLINKDSKFVQFGIVSFGPKYCGMANQPGVYTKVAFYMDWLLDNIKP